MKGNAAPAATSRSAGGMPSRWDTRPARCVIRGGEGFAHHGSRKPPLTRTLVTCHRAYGGIIFKEASCLMKCSVPATTQEIAADTTPLAAKPNAAQSLVSTIAQTGIAFAFMLDLTFETRN
jgi:hypothetical protein